MATATTAKKSGIGEKVKETGNKAKTYVKGKYDKAKTWVSNYKNDVNKSYCKGYAQGYQDAQNLPKRPGTAMAAGVGYYTGIVNANKKAKAEKKYEKAKTKMQGK